MAIRWLGIKKPPEAECGDLPPDRPPSAVDWGPLESAPSVQVISPGRSGTRWLADVLVRISGALVVHSTKRTLAETGLLYFQNRISNEAAYGGYLQSRLPLLSESLRSGRTLVDLDCKNAPLAPALAARRSNMSFVVMLREPSYFIRSGLVRGYFRSTIPFHWGHLCPADYDYLFRTRPDIALAEQARLVADFWNAVANVAEQVRGEFPDRVVVLPVQAMFSAPEVLVDRLDRLGLTIERSRLADFKEYAKVKNRNTKREPTPEEREIAESLREYALQGIGASFAEELFPR